MQQDILLFMAFYSTMVGFGTVHQQVTNRCQLPSQDTHSLHMHLLMPLFWHAVKKLKASIVSSTAGREENGRSFVLMSEKDQIV